MSLYASTWEARSDLVSRTPSFAKLWKDAELCP